MKAVILENIRSAYNVWNIVRTADALGFDIIVSGYTPNPLTEPKVQKTALWAQDNIQIFEFRDTAQAVQFARKVYGYVIAAEFTKNSIDLKQFAKKLQTNQDIAIVLGSETEWVLGTTLQAVDEVVHINMQGTKESLNVGQAAAIFMYMVL